MARFGAVGATGIAINLLSLHVLAAVLHLPEALASALAIEASVLSNFVLHDAITFRDRRDAATGTAGRLLRYHAVCAVGSVVQLGTFVVASALLTQALGRPEIGSLRYPAQLLGIILGFAWNFVASARWAWGAQANPGAVRRSASLARAAAPVLFFSLLVLHALPMWLVPYFPTQDGPLHVENVVALLRHGESSLLARYYLANWGAQPNWITQTLLAGLLRVVPAVTAEKIVLTGYAVLLPLLFRAALPRGQLGWWASLTIFPFVHSFPFQMGFWNFCYGLALFCGALALWNRRRGRLSPARGIVLALVAVLLFFAHSFAYAAFVVAVGAHLGWRAWLAIRGTRGQPARRRRVLRGYALRATAAAAVLLPGAVLLAGWFFAHRDRISSRIPLLELAARFATLYALVSIDRRELFLAAAVALAVAVGVVHLVLARTARPLRPNDGWLLAALIFGVLYFAIPDVTSGGAYVSDRLALSAFICALAWIGTGAGPILAVRRLGIALAALALVALGVRIEKERALSPYLEEYVSASREAVRPGSVVLPLAFSPWGPRDDAGRRMGYRVKPFLHAVGYAVAEQGAIDLDNSQANTDQCPVRFRPGLNPFRTIAPSLGAMEGAPPCVDLSRGAPDGRRIDLVLVWGRTPELGERPCGIAIDEDLEAGYERVGVSRPRGMLEAWTPRGARAER
jgi:putative flippase GtrA